MDKNVANPVEQRLSAFDEYKRRRWNEDKDLRLAMCCGKTHYGDDWFCTDLVAKPAKKIYSLDITKTFGIDSDQLSFIYVEHGMEHVTLDGVLACFSECHRTLRNRGAVYITVARELDQVLPVRQRTQ